MYEDNDNQGPFLKLRKQHQKLADDLGMSTSEYLDYRAKIDSLELKRRTSESNPVPLHLKKATNIDDNIDNLGYSKHFLTREDAEFFYEKMVKWEEDNSYMVSVDEDEYSEAARQEQIRAFMTTGVKYHFQEIGITIYTAFGFAQMDFHNHRSYLDYQYRAYSYNHRSGEFENIGDDDWVEVKFSGK